MQESKMSKDENEQYEFLFKIILIGDAGVGKTCIVQRYKTGVWVESQASTIGVDFCMKTCMIKGKRVKLQVWDTAGQERFRTITQSYYRSAHAVICVFDLTQRKTFDNLDKWMEDVIKFCNPNVITLLIGNKSDMEDSREVTKLESVEFGSNFHVVEYIETSAKDNRNIDSSFQKIAALLVEMYTNKKLYDDNRQNSAFSLGTGARSKPVGNMCNC